MAVRGVNIKIEGLSHRYTSKSPLTFDQVDIEAQQGESLINYRPLWMWKVYTFADHGRLIKSN